MTHIAPTSALAAPSEILTEFRCRLEEARRLGMTFDGAWRRALWARQWCGNSGPWRHALDATRDEWERAYIGQPSPIAGALDALARALAEIETVRIAELDPRRTLAA